MTITPVRPSGDEISHFVAIKVDTTTRKRQEAEIERLATRDPLTGLPNRDAFLVALGDAVGRAKRGFPGALLLLDLDRFALVNDSLGHPSGDHLLVVLAEVLAFGLRPGDYLARLGGDDFGVLLAEPTLGGAEVAAERLRQLVSQRRFQVEGAAFDLAFSGGLCPVDGSLTPQSALALADAALREAKEQGRNRLVARRSAEDIASRITESSLWATRVKDALKTDQLFLEYQPVVSLQDETARHHEALVRMRREDGSVVPPGVFLPVAARFGLMPEVDRWVIQKAVAELGARPGLRLFVNVSGAGLSDPDLLSWLTAFLTASRLEPGRLAFEITETTAVSDLPAVQRWIRSLKELGCSVALDDFGVGFSSFTYLRSLAVDTIKLDGTFVKDLDGDATSRAVVRSMVTVAKALGKEVIAEMVERPEVAAILKELEVGYGQGWLWGRPNVVPQEARRAG